MSSTLHKIVNEFVALALLSIIAAKSFFSRCTFTALLPIVSPNGNTVASEFVKCLEPKIFSFRLSSIVVLKKNILA